MALSHDWLSQSTNFLWIFTLLLADSHSKRTQEFYMEGKDCNESVKFLGGAVVYSHYLYSEKLYSNNLECRIYFKAQHKGWKLMLRVLQLDIPDIKSNGICNDALYVYDSDDIYTQGMDLAGGNYGICGQRLPPPLYSTEEYLTVHFRTNTKGKRGQGFKFVVTAFSDGPCDSFVCDNKKCIDQDLTCDGVDHCGDYSDEAADGPAKCGVEDDNFLTKLLSLGVTASVSICVGSLIVIIVCIVAIVCCCRRSCGKERRDNSTTTTTTSVVTNGMPTFTQGHNHQNHPPHHQLVPFNNHSHQGYFPMQPVYPSPHGSMYSGYNREQYGGHTTSVYSSQPPSHHRSYTPTSSKSGKSNRSNTSTSVTYSQNTDKVTLPINL